MHVCIRQNILQLVILILQMGLYPNGLAGGVDWDIKLTGGVGWHTVLAGGGGAW